MTDLLVGMWTGLAAAYPAGHFDGNDPEVFFRDYLAARLRWRSALVPENTEDPIRALEVRRAVLSDAEAAVADTVAALFRGNDQVMPGLWAEWWQKAKAVRLQIPPIGFDRFHASGVAEIQLQPGEILLGEPYWRDELSRRCLRPRRPNEHGRTVWLWLW